MQTDPTVHLLHPVVSPGQADETVTEDQPLSAVAVSPDRRLLALCSHRGEISLRCTETRRELRRLTGHTHRIHACAFSPDSRWLLTAGLDGKLLRFGVDAGFSEVIFAGQRALNACDIDDERVAAAGDDGMVRLWVRGEVTVLPGHTGMATALALHPDGTRLVSGGIDGAVRLWAPESQERRTLYRHTGAVTAARITPDGAVLVTAGTEGRLKVWDLRRGVLIGELTGHEGPITCCAVSPDGRKLVSGAIDRTVATWDLRTGLRLRTFTSHSDAVMGVAWGARVWSVSEDGTAQAFNPAEQPSPPVRQLRHYDAVTAAAFFGDLLVTTSFDSTLRTWDVEYGASVQIRDDALGGLTDMAMSDDQRLLACASEDGFARIYRLAEGWVPGLTLPTGAIHTVAFLTRHTLLTAGPDQPLQVWSLLDGSPLFALGARGVSRCAVLRDGELLTADSTHPPVRWSGGEPTGSLGDAPACALATHGDTIAVGRATGVVEIWTDGDDSPGALQKLHRGPVTALALLPDGRVASSAEGEPMVLWSPTTDTVTQLPTHGTIRTITADRGRIAAGDDAGNVWIFAVDEVALSAAA